MRTGRAASRATEYGTPSEIAYARRATTRAMMTEIRIAVASPEVYATNATFLADRALGPRSLASRWGGHIVWWSGGTASRLAGPVRLAAARSSQERRSARAKPVCGRGPGEERLSVSEEEFVLEVVFRDPERVLEPRERLPDHHRKSGHVDFRTTEFLHGVAKPREVDPARPASPRLGGFRRPRNGVADLERPVPSCDRVEL